MIAWPVYTSETAEEEGVRVPTSDQYPTVLLGRTPRRLGGVSSSLTRRLDKGRGVRPALPSSCIRQKP